MTRWNTKKENPTEFQEQCKLAEYLDMKGYCWCHVPNGGNRDAITGARMKKQGVKPGVPDCIIFDIPDKFNSLYNPGYGIHGIAIELKRKKCGQVRESQAEWIRNLDKRCWLTKVAYGADEAIEWLDEIFEEG